MNGHNRHTSRLVTWCGVLAVIATTTASAQTDWSRRIDEALADESHRAWTSYFALGQQLAEVPGREGLDALIAAWPTIDNTSFKQQIIKAWQFDYPMPYGVRFHPLAFEFFEFVLGQKEPDVNSWVHNYLPSYAWRTFDRDDDALAWLAEHRGRPSQAVAITSMERWISELSHALEVGDPPGAVLNRIDDFGWPWRRNEPLLDVARTLGLPDLVLKAIEHESVTSSTISHIAYMLSEIDPERFPNDKVDAFIAHHRKRNEAATEATVEDRPESLHVRTIESDGRKRWILHPPLDETLPQSGAGLLVVLPGGDGSIDFAPFVHDTIRASAGSDYVLVQMIAPPIGTDAENVIVWPSVHLPDDRVPFSIEPVVRAAVEVAKIEHRIDPDRIWVMGWSSGGPPAYELAIMPDSPFSGAFVVMSVFKPNLLSPLTGAMGKSFYILHSPHDFIAMRFPEAAVSQLAGVGARTTLVVYEGGHGWHGDIAARIRAAIDWLEE